MTADGTTGLGVLEWGQQCGALDVFADLKKVICGIDGETLDEGRFVRVLAGQDEGPPRIPRRQRAARAASRIPVTGRRLPEKASSPWTSRRSSRSHLS